VAEKKVVGFVACAWNGRDSAARHDVEVFGIEAGDTPDRVAKAMALVGVASETIEALVSNVASPMAKASSPYDFRDTQTGRFAKRTGLWEHGGGVLPALRGHR
jgi:hypothetical protein